MSNVVIPEHTPCPKKGCKDVVNDDGNVVAPGGRMYLDPKVYQFLNTKKPYMLRVCDKCSNARLIVLPED